MGWADPLTPAERRMLAAFLGRAVRACAFTGRDGTYSLGAVVTAAECRALRRDVTTEAAALCPPHMTKAPLFAAEAPSEPSTKKGRSMHTVTRPPDITADPPPDVTPYFADYAAIDAAVAEHLALAAA